MSDYLLLEDGGKIQFEDASGYYLLEALFILPRRLAYVKQEDRFADVIQDDRFEDVIGGE